MGHSDDRFADLLAALGSDRRPPGASAVSTAEEEVPLGRHRGRRERGDVRAGGGSGPEQEADDAADEPPGRVRALTLPVALRSAQVRVSAAAVWGMVVLVVAVGAVLGVRVAWAERQAVPEPLPAPTAQPEAAGEATTPDPAAGPAAQATVAGEGVAGQGVADGAAGGPSAATDTGQATAPGPTTPALLVHVIGAVDTPGVVEVPPGSRVQDAVDRAGGELGAADLTRINLARAVVDGERIWVPVEGEDPPEDVTGPAVGTGPAASGGTDGPGGPGEPSPVVDLNTADAGLLDTLPGVGPVTAEAILQWRTDNGSFTSVEELLEVSGIGERTLEDLRPHVSVLP